MAVLGARVSDEFVDQVTVSAKAAGMSVSKFVASAVESRLVNGPEKDPRQLELRELPDNETISKHRDAVLGLLMRDGPATKFELAEKLRWHEHWVSPRLTELLKSKQIVRGGKKINPNSGRPCSVWIAKPKEAA